jgi:CRISPR-associated protein Cas5t
MPFLTPSAAYGLVLNLASVESRFDDGKSPMTLMRQDLPPLEMALGAVKIPEVHSIYQQLHNYPVGASGKERAEGCKGAKYNIQPVRREFLSGIDAYVCCRGNSQLEDTARQGLAGKASGGLGRYGLPFLGNNNFLIDTLREEVEPNATATWLVRLHPSDHQEGTGRFPLPVMIDRSDMTLTASALFCWGGEALREPPDSAWTTIDFSAKRGQGTAGTGATARDLQAE